jgi:phosphoribosylformylglycinamidine synthase subunit PurL
MNEKTKAAENFSIDQIPEPEDIGEVIYSMIVNANLSSINYFNDFTEQGLTPDSIGGIDTDERGIFELDSNGHSMAMSTHAFHHHLQTHPKQATEILVSRAVRKMLCFGAKPVAVSSLLYHIDFSDPLGQVIASGAKQGLENAAGIFNLKIADRKIRFDHFMGYGPLSPTIILSIIATIENKDKLISGEFKNKGNNIFLIGRSVEDIGSSEYLQFYHGNTDSPLPWFDIDSEIQLQQALYKLNELNLLNSANPVGKGGLFFTLLRACIPNNLGFDITTDAEIRRDAFLFGESMGRVIVDVTPEKEDLFVDTLAELRIPFFTVGHITKGEIRIDDISFGHTGKMGAVL